MCLCREGEALPGSDDAELRGGLLPQPGGQGGSEDQRRDREAAPPGQEEVPPRVQAAAAR